MERLQLLVESNGLGDQELSSCFASAVFIASSSTSGVLQRRKRSRDRRRIASLPTRSASSSSSARLHERTKALAEVGALLLLQKKAQALYRDGVF